MRNFYLTADIDGRRTLLTGGPRTKDGEMTIELRQRVNGRSVVAFRINCVEHDGELESIVIDSHGCEVDTFASRR